MNNHVTPFFGKLLAEGRRAVKDRKIHSVWLTRNGCTMRFEENGNELVYHSVKELDEMILSHGKSVQQKKRTRSDDNDIPPVNTRRQKK